MSAAYTFAEKVRESPNIEKRVKHLSKSNRKSSTTKFINYWIRINTNQIIHLALFSRLLRQSYQTSKLNGHSNCCSSVHNIISGLCWANWWKISYLKLLFNDLSALPVESTRNPTPTSWILNASREKQSTYSAGQALTKPLNYVIRV